MTFKDVKLPVCIIILLILVCNLNFNLSHENNVCPTIEDYKTIKHNPNCWFNYIANGTVPECIVHSGRPIETHKVTTEDGYILTMFRMPNTKRKNPVLLQHGIFATSANWISLGEDSLAFQLYDQGYDVWLGNYRGSQYSPEHVKYTVEDNEFWQFSVDELSLDVPAMLSKIANVTNSAGQIVYIGHSLGTTMTLMYSSARPSHASQLMKLQILIAPISTLSYLRGLATYVAPFDNIIYNTVSRIEGLMKVLAKEKSSKTLFQTVCFDSAEMMQQCMALMLNIFGTKTTMKPDKYPLYWQQHPSGTSLRILKHLSDFSRNHFRKYDFGYNGNMLAYNTATPPTYDVTRITVPTIIFFTKNDWLSPPEDALKLYKLLSPAVRNGMYRISPKSEYFNHVDYLFGDSGKEMFINLFLKVLHKKLQ